VWGNAGWNCLHYAGAKNRRIDEPTSDSVRRRPAGPYWVRIARDGPIRFQASYSANGTTWTQLGSPEEKSTCSNKRFTLGWGRGKAEMATCSTPRTWTMSIAIPVNLYEDEFAAKAIKLPRPRGFFARAGELFIGIGLIVPAGLWMDACVHGEIKQLRQPGWEAPPVNVGGEQLPHNHHSKVSQDARPPE